MGHEERFPPSRLSGRYRFNQRTFAGKRGNGREAPLAVIRRRCAHRPNRQPMVARVDQGMIRSERRSRRGPQMSAMPDSALADTEQLIADLQRQIVESEAGRDECRKGRPGPRRCCRSSIPRPATSRRYSRCACRAAGMATKDALDARRAGTPSVAAGESPAYGSPAIPTHDGPCPNCHGLPSLQKGVRLV